MPAPTAGRPQGDPGSLQVGGRRFAPNTGVPLDAPQRPAQPPQSEDLLFLFFGQDVTHIAEGIGPRVGINVLDSGLSLAGFQVIIDGRFWVFTEAASPTLPERNKAAFSSVQRKKSSSYNDDLLPPIIFIIPLFEPAA
jgi:hypothetical protein